MKKIILIDTIADDRSIDQLKHLVQILELDYQSKSHAAHPEKEFQIRAFHLATEPLDIQELADSDAVIFSGSMKSVYDDFAWKDKMHQAFETVIEKQIPTMAICFGAQFLAYHLGGNVIKNPQGIEFGPIKVELTEAGNQHPLLKQHAQDFLFATHQDIIENTPPGATLLAYNQNTPVQAFQFGPITATQFHIDIPTTRAQMLLESRKQKYLDSGFLKDEQHYEEMLKNLHLGENSHNILRDFLAAVN